MADASPITNVRELGPFKVIHLFFPRSGFTAYVVVDNIALGPSIGGVRMSPDVTLEEVKRLARTMTMKNSIAELPHGGGKAGIVADPKTADKEHLFRVFAQAIRDMTDYIPGPDMGSNEECMAWVYDEIGRAVGLPEEIGGLPLDELGATGFGLAASAEVAAPFAGITLNGATVAIQGFGSVGKAAARFLSEKGAVVISVSDTQGSICNPAGLDVREIIAVKLRTGSVLHYGKATAGTCDELFTTSADILIPAARPDVVHMDNVDRLRFRLILQGANIPITRDAEERLHERGILSVPDFIANAGGVIMAAMEYAKKTKREAFEVILDRIRENTGLILETSLKERVPPRLAAEEIARARVLRAMSFRRVL